MLNKLIRFYLFFILSLVLFEEAFVIAELADKYESTDVICGKCNCTSPSEEDGNEEIFTVDCSMKDLPFILSEWPEGIGDKYKEIIYVMSFNTLNKLPQFPTTEAVLFFICKNCHIKEISDNVFIDAKNIISLDLSHNEISSTSLNPDVFRGPYSDVNYSPINLQILDLSHNKITYLDEKLFEHAPYLKKVVLSYNNLEKIEDGTLEALANLKNLEILYLENVGISELRAELFQNMKHLSELFISENLFTDIPASLSNIRLSLELLCLNNNPIEVIHSTSFENLEKLEKLFLNNMQNLRSIENGSFMHLKSLEVLTCKENKNLVEMNLEDLLELIHLKELDISNNRLKTLNFGEMVDIEHLENETIKVNYFENLHYLKLSGNPWHCDCSMIKALDFFNHNSTYFKKAEKSDEARCASPYDLYSKLLYILPFDYVCAADIKSKPMKIPVYEPPQFLRPKSIFLTIGSVVLVIVLGMITGILIVIISRRLKSNRNIGSDPVRYSTVRNSTVSNVVAYNNYQQP